MQITVNAPGKFRAEFDVDPDELEAHHTVDEIDDESGIEALTIDVDGVPMAVVMANGDAVVHIDGKDVRCVFDPDYARRLNPEPGDGDIGGSLELFDRDGRWWVNFSGSLFGPYADEDAAIDAVPSCIRDTF